MDIKTSGAIEEGILLLLPRAREEAAAHAAWWLAGEMRWQFRHIIAADLGPVTWGDVAPMICSRFEGQAPPDKLMRAVERGISPLTLDDPVYPPIP